jgi:rhamnulokinase
MPAHHYIAIDLGAESGRVMLGCLRDGVLSLEEVHRFSNSPVRMEGGIHWDTMRLWEEIKAGLRLVAGRGLAVAGIGVDSWGLDYVLMGRGSPMLRVPYCYRDARTEAVYPGLLGQVGKSEIYRLTGTQFMPINTLYQLAAEQRQEPEQLGQAERFLMIGDWFQFLLCGRAAQEESNASTTQLWNPRKREWSEELIAAAGLPRRIFPEVVPPCTMLGRLGADVRQETGLGEMDVVAGCVHDTGAAVAAVPAEGKGWAYLSSGTWSLIGVELQEPLICEAAREANFTNETGVGGTSRFLRNASGLWILQECRRAWARAGREMDYGDLTQLAIEAEPFRSLVNPDDPRFLRPDEMLDAVRDFCRETGQPEPATPGQYARCAIESLALLYAQVMEQLERVTGEKLDTLHIVGGGSKNRLLNQLTADATGRTVVAGPVEAAAAGNVLLQALTPGQIGTHAELRRIIRASFPVEKYLPNHTADWRDALGRFGRLQES